MPHAPDPQIGYDANSNLVWVRGARNPATGRVIDDAVVSARIKKSDGTDVAGFLQPLGIGATTTPGSYAGAIPDTAVWDDPTGYYVAEVTMIGGQPGEKGFWKIKFRIRERKS